MTTRRTHNTICANERAWTLALFSVLIFVFILYIYFVTSSVFHVVLRQELNQKITEAKSEISSLESEYMETQYTISNEFASREGYVDVEEKIYIDRAPETLVLSLQQ